MQRALDRRSIRKACEGMAGVELVGVVMAADPVLKLLREHDVDFLIVDDELPGLAEAVQQIRVDHPRLHPLVVTSDAGATKERLGWRAVAIPRSEDEAELADALRRQLKRPTRDAGARTAPTESAPALPSTSTTTASVGATTSRYKRRELLVIGCSTGGPEALAVVLNHLPSNFPVPIVIVQHMPAGFTKPLADQLDRSCALQVREVTGPLQAKRGEVWIAPGDRHVVMTRMGGHLMLDDGPMENACRPSVDTLFRSAAKVYGRRTLAAVLTGMGDDGCRGAKLLSEAGAHIIAQDEETSVVWGMAGAVVRAGVSDKVVPLTAIAAEICDQFPSSVTVGQP